MQDLAWPAALSSSESSNVTQRYQAGGTFSLHDLLLAGLGETVHFGARGGRARVSLR